MSSLYCSGEILLRTILAPNVRAMVDPYSEDIGSQMSLLYVLYPRYRQIAGKFPAEILAPKFVVFWGHIARTFYLNCYHFVLAIGHKLLPLYLNGAIVKNSEDNFVL